MSRRLMATLMMLGLVASLGVAAEADEKKDGQKKAVVAAEAKTVSPSAVDGDSALVRAAKSVPAKRDRATIKIDNAAVKKANGKVTVAADRPMPKIDHSNSSSAIIARHDAALGQWRKDVAAANDRVKNLTREIEELEGMLGRYEEDFYNEDDPGYRDQLEGKYDSADVRLKTAREELAAARQQANDLEKNKPRLY